MSSELGIQFGERYGEKYGEVIETWVSKLEGKKVTPELFSEWGEDLREALSEELMESLISLLSSWKGVKLPSQETLKRFSQISIKYALQYATRDLLDRLAISSKNSVTAAMRPSELIKRAPQTVAQIFDMSKDRYSAVLNRFLTKTQQFTGRRMWVTSSKTSRHASLNGDIKGSGEFFTFNKEKIVGPRPAGGQPASWSNCSCKLFYEKKGGKWVE